MVVRIITGTVLGALALPAILLGGYYFIALLLTAAVLGTYEFLRALKKGGLNPAVTPAVIISAALVAGIFSKNKTPGNIVFTDNGFNFFPMFLTAAILAAAGIFVFDHKHRKFEDAAFPVYGSLYISMLLWCGMALRILDQGVHLVIVTLVGVILSDTCAYFFGRAFGKKKLCPDISPKKTFAGMYGGLAGGALGVVVYSLVIMLVGIDTGIPFWFSPVLGAGVSIISMAGDLVMSAVKRQCGIKDFSNILPGHGGVLDRVDSVLPSLALTYFVEIVFSQF